MHAYLWAYIYKQYIYIYIYIYVYIYLYTHACIIDMIWADLPKRGASKSL